MSYIGGCVFGLIMLAFSQLGNNRFETHITGLEESQKTFYKDMKEFKAAMRTVKLYSLLLRKFYHHCTEMVILSLEYPLQLEYSTL